MPSLSTVNYEALLQKITALEIKVHRIEVNVEVNGLCGNETTLPATQNSRVERANTRLKGKDNTTQKKAASVSNNNKSSSDNPHWNRLGAKPKSKSCLLEKGECEADRANVCNEADWPPPTATRDKKIIHRPQKQLIVKLQNRFAVLSEDPGSLPDDHPSQGSRVKTDHLSESKRPKRKLRKLKAGPETLIIGDSTVKDVQWLCGKNTKVLCFPKDMVGDIQERFLKTLAGYPTVRNIVLHTGLNDVSKQQSEALNRDFTELIKTVRSLDAAVFISGPVPTIRGGDLRFSRLLALNDWLLSACANNNLHFINNFRIFWEQRHLFRANDLNLNRSGVLKTWPRIHTHTVTH
uniref:SGNH hydrolase-type esterase domain-containing protein n=1 Tax=Cyprinodon variegatus TaxID=28743 RepID=A0A3Q2EBE6_CYPVA